jgi:hypothetical protein
LGTTPNGIPFPDDDDDADGPGAMAAMASAIDSRIVGRFSTLTALRSVIATPVLGMLAYVNTGGLYEFDGVDWVPFQGLRGLTFSSTQYDSGVGSNPAGTVEQRITGDLNMTNRRCLSGRMYYIAWRGRAWPSVASTLMTLNIRASKTTPVTASSKLVATLSIKPAGNTANSVPDCPFGDWFAVNSTDDYHFALFGVSASGQFHVGEDDRGRFQLLLKEDGASLPGLVTVT